ncbi:MAG: hypothetical protein RLZZ196_67 [Bacteroidota bacterium]|jgi:hypothetical protein
MAANVKNVLVGAAQIFVSTGTGASRPSTTPGAGNLAWGSQKAGGYLASSSSWRDVGYTNTGFEISYEPGYGEVMVDQLLDAARLFKQTIKVMLKTELTEGTLENINLVFGQSDPILTYSGSTGTSNTTFTPAEDSSAGAYNAKLNLAAGALGDAPVERSLVAIGQAPANIGTDADPVDVSSVNKKERIYVARRVVQVEVTSHGLKRDTATVFPVQFRCLPDDNDAYDGAEYGVIIDRVYSTV